MPFPVDEEKGRARFDKSKHSLTITLPVLPGKPPTVEPLVTEVAPKLTNQDEEPESHDSNKLTNPKESCDSSELTNPEESCDSSELTNQIKASDDAIVNDTITENEGLKLEATPTQPTNQISGHVSQQWPSSSSGAWQCPPFNYRQDDESVSFVLLTANVKENSLVSYFDQHYVSLTFFYQATTSTKPSSKRENVIGSNGAVGGGDFNHSSWEEEEALVLLSLNERTNYYMLVMNCIPTRSHVPGV